MASFVTPKSQGEYLGKVLSAKGNVITIDTDASIANGDGLARINSSGHYDGFRVNKTDGDRIYLKSTVPVGRGDKIFRTHDKSFNDFLIKHSATRKISVDFTMWCQGQQLCLKASDERGCMAVHSLLLDTKPEIPKSPQSERQRQVLAKLGDTIFTMRSCKIEGDYFIPASVLASLRRGTIALLEESQKVTYRRDLRKIEDLNAVFPQQSLESADNVANHIARTFYREHGVTSITPAIECGNMVKANQPVMKTRYCLRRELGACLKEKHLTQTLPSTLLLRNGRTLLRANFDCSRCEMTITIVK